MLSLQDYLDHAPVPQGAVHVSRLQDAGKMVDLLMQSQASGAACLWVRNAVDDGTDAVGALPGRGAEATLLHLRFTLEDSRRIEAEALSRLGGQGWLWRRVGCVVWSR